MAKRKQNDLYAEIDASKISADSSPLSQKEESIIDALRGRRSYDAEIDALRDLRPTMVHPRNLTFTDLSEVWYTSPKGDRKLSPSVKLLTAKMKRKGFLATFPIIVEKRADGKLAIRQGNQRTMAAIMAGIDEIPAYVLEGASEDIVSDIEDWGNDQKGPRESGPGYIARVERMERRRRKLRLLKLDGKKVNIDQQLQAEGYRSPAKMHTIYVCRNVLFPYIRDRKLSPSVAYKLATLSRVKGTRGKYDMTDLARRVEKYIRDRTIDADADAEKVKLRNRIADAIIGVMAEEEGMDAADARDLRGHIIRAFDTGVKFARSPKEAFADWSEFLETNDADAGEVDAADVDADALKEA